MKSIPQSIQVIQSLRPGDLVGHCQQPERRSLAARLPEAALRFIALEDVVVPF
ncbi:hypothetical protein N836_24545 [Leptolyngbya sp. Heron Island J]|uniref:hypothetical protein n=1 Tax=Leptolyngbya sp. Heron Island J TaxID=1385935 RepID=UPI0003B9AF68|nr:hypothetical protein [Leptolyngbya sp. Heron Island J]ESA32784.1 hypothetical protein N836_24545 [Leptolyngbya sp. Heron Island J]